MEWYYAVNDERRGPVTDAEFQVLVSNGTIRPSTLVWRQGLADWSPLSALSGGVPNYTGETGMRFAGFWIRFVAKVLDIIILSIVGLVLTVVMGFVGGFAYGNGIEAALELLEIFVALAVNVLYYTLFVGAYGATPGKLAIGLRIVRADGSPVSYPLAFGRYVAAALNYVTLGIGWFMAGWNEEKRGLHDYICDTRVIHSS